MISSSLPPFFTPRRAGVLGTGFSPRRILRLSRAEGTPVLSATNVHPRGLRIQTSAVTCGCTGGDGGRGSSRLDHGKLPPCERVPHPLPPCPRAGLLAALRFGWFVVPLRFTSLSPSCSLPSPPRLGLYLVFVFSPSLLFSLFSHLWLWASSGAPRQL